MPCSVSAVSTSSRRAWHGCSDGRRPLGGNGSLSSGLGDHGCEWQAAAPASGLAPARRRRETLDDLLVSDQEVALWAPRQAAAGSNPGRLTASRPAKRRRSPPPIPLLRPRLARATPADEKWCS